MNFKQRLDFDFEAHVEKDVGRVRPLVQWSASLPHDEEVHGLIPFTLLIGAKSRTMGSDLDECIVIAK